MANSTQSVMVTDTPLSLLNVSLDYFRRSEIAVYKNGLLMATGWNWVGTSAKQIQFNPAIPVGDIIIVRRTTDVSDMLNIFVGGAQFSEQAIDENFTQILHVAQEFQEGAGVSGFYSDVDMHNFRINNLRAGNADTDAANVGQVAGIVAPYKADAQAAAVEAGNYASAAHTYSINCESIKQYTQNLYDSMDTRLLYMVEHTNSGHTGSSKLSAGTTEQRDSPAQVGFTRWNTSLKQLETYNGPTDGWLGAGAVGGGTDKAFYENDKTITTDYTITTDKNAMTAGPVTVSAVVTVPSGSTWTVVGG